MFSKSLEFFPATVESIKEVNSISDVISSLSNITENTIIGCDLDLTAFDAADAIMSDRYKEDRMKFIKHVKEMTGQKAVEIIYNQAKDTLIESTFPQAIKQLQIKHKVFAFTARRPGYPSAITSELAEDTLINRLQKLNLDFSGSFPDTQFNEFNNQLENAEMLHDAKLLSTPFYKPNPPLLKSGILLAANIKKEYILDAFFKKFGAPKIFVMIDDNVENLKPIAKICENYQVKFVGFHYKAAYIYGKKLDAEIVNFQLNNLTENKEWYSDEEVAYLLFAKNVVLT